MVTTNRQLPLKIANEHSTAHGPKKCTQCGRGLATDDREQFVAMSAAAKSAFVLGQQIALPPDGCQLCLNTREVASSLMPGQLTKCPACAEREGAVAS